MVLAMCCLNSDSFMAGLRALRHHRIENIIVGEGCEHSDTLKAFKIAGADTRKERWGVKLVDLYKDEFIEVRPSDSLAKKRLRFPGFNYKKWN